ncbi:MAG: Sjogren's syndrome/scleroderma autoantigen 1 family protein [Candidatus Ranarchaeia archaeon]
MEKEPITDMAKLLLNGAKMTDLACPKCNTILFELQNGDLYCAKCKKKVVIVKEGEEIEESDHEIEHDESIELLKKSIHAKLKVYSEKLENTKEAQKINETLKVINNLLGTLDVLKRLA